MFRQVCLNGAIWPTRTDDQILQGYKSSLGANWDQLANSFPAVLRQRLRERYEV
jgi:hypothetical protein